MEISVIDTIQPAQLKKRLIEAKKKQKWVEMVKALPDVRADKMNLSHKDLSNTQLLTIAQDILESGII
jgi:hypothetical protein